MHYVRELNIWWAVKSLKKNPNKYRYGHFVFKFTLDEWNWLEIHGGYDRNSNAKNWKNKKTRCFSLVVKMQDKKMNNFYFIIWVAIHIINAHVFSYAAQRLRKLCWLNEIENISKVYYKPVNRIVKSEQQWILRRNKKQNKPSHCTCELYSVNNAVNGIE